MKTEPKTDGQVMNIRVETFAFWGVPTRFPNVFSIISPDLFNEIMPPAVNVRSLTFFKPVESISEQALGYFKSSAGTQIPTRPQAPKLRRFPFRRPNRFEAQMSVVLGQLGHCHERTSEHAVARFAVAV